MGEIAVTETSVDVLPPDDELASLKRLLAEKDHAVVRAIVAASEAQNEIDALRTENSVLRAEAEAARQEQQTNQIAKLRSQWRATEKNLEKQRDDIRAELIGVRSRWQQTQQELQRETRARRTDALRSASEIAALRNDVTRARESAPRRNRVFSKRHALAAAAVCAAILVAGFAALQYRPRPKAPSPLAVTARVSSAPAPHLAGSNTNQPPRGFQSSLGGLSDALAGYPGAAPEAILKAVRRQDPGACPIEWNSGQPALIFGGKEPMSAALTRCAQAVRNLGAEQAREEQQEKEPVPGHP